MRRAIPSVVVGVDRGGTWLRVKVLTLDGKTIRSHRLRSSAQENIAVLLRRLFGGWRIRPQAVVIASRGIWTTSERRALERQCRGLAPRVRAISDVEAAWLAAFGASTTAVGQGVLIISGTGSIAFGRNSQGRQARAGGLGPLIGDEGSAFWIGREWVKTAALIPPRGYTAATIASYTNDVFSAARRGNRKAITILSKAQNHLVDLVHTLAPQLNLRRPVPVSWAGAVLDEPFFRKGFLERLLKRRGAFQPIAPSTDPATAAAQFALTL